MTRTERPTHEICYALMGSGRAATHFARYLDHLGIPYRRWSRALEEEPGQAFIQATSLCTHALLLVPDAIIEPLARKARHALAGAISRELTWVHFSGSLTTPLAWGCHPLMSFAKDRFYEPEVYRSMSFIVDRDAPIFAELLPGLPNLHYRLDPEKKAFYHALCVLAGNYSTLLWRKLFDDLENRLLIPKKAAAPYLKTVTENLLRHPDSALTGPLVRGDADTLARNHAALAGDPYQAVYDAFVRAFNEQRAKGGAP